MAVGLKVRDPVTLAVVSDVTTRLSRVLGTLFAPAGSTGTITNAGFTTGTPYCICVLTNAGMFGNGALAAPITYMSGATTMVYDIAAPSGDHLLIYGVH